MLKIISLIVCVGMFASGGADDLLGKGLWSLISVSKCPEHSLSKETITFDVNKHKLNRTQDGISAHITITEEITESYGIFIEVCKYVDGGCKQYQVVSDNMGKLCDKYARENVMRALQLGSFKNDYFPVEEGEYDLEDFIFDYCVLPQDCPFGKYEALAYLIMNQERISCLKIIIECNKCEEDEECCNRDDK